MLTTISAYQITAADFFQRLQNESIDLLLDVRLKNESQLCGFTKKADLAYLVSAICHAKYVHDPLFAPNPLLLEQYLKRWIPWETYAAQYLQALQGMDGIRLFQERYGQYCHICLLGTATKQRRSHSEVLQNYLEEAFK